MKPYQLVHTLVLLFYPTIDADGIWLDVPDEHVNVKQGNNLSLHWHYEMEKDNSFLVSAITISTNGQPLPIAERYRHHNKYVENDNFRKMNLSVSIFGKNNVTLIVHSDKIAYYVIVYCCVVKWETDGIHEERKCSTISVYDLPRITHHTSDLSCKQGDSITLQCNATGYPEPRIVWMYNNVSGSAVINITGKMSEGNYCCDAKNIFGSKTACTTVNVTEFAPEHTYILVSRSYRHNVNIFNITCTAVASPPVDNFIITTDNEEHNSSDGVEVIIVKPPKKDMIIRCVPCNRYGQGPKKEVILPVNVPPRFPYPMVTQYNMTIREITIHCHATGRPVPSIRWTREDTGEIVSTTEDYTIPYMKCVSKTMIFLCHAFNVMRIVKSSKIEVKVMTQHNCTTTDKDVTRSMKNHSETVIIIVSLSVFAFVVIVTTFWTLHRRKTMYRERKDKKGKQIDENPYQEPIDHVPLSKENLMDRNVLRDEDGYATLEDCGLV